MNICECGCEQECKNRFIRGHNNRKVKEKTIVNLDVDALKLELEIIENIEKPIEEKIVTVVIEEEEFKPKENYTLTNISKDVIINYEAGKKWLDKTFEKYTVYLLHNKEELPYKIILSANRSKDIKKPDWLIGKGDTFSNALKEILINV